MKSFAKIQKKAIAFMDRTLKSGMQTTITYKMFVSSEYNDATGMSETTYAEYEIDSIKVDASLQAQMASSILAGVSFGAGQIIYLIKHEDMPRTDVYHPDILKDYVVDNSEEKQVKMAIPMLDTFIKVVI
jgi:transcriptional regulator with XRE-family HTH domain